MRAGGEANMAGEIGADHGGTPPLLATLANWIMDYSRILRSLGLNLPQATLVRPCLGLEEVTLNSGKVSISVVLGRNQNQSQNQNQIRENKEI